MGKVFAVLLGAKLIRSGSNEVEWQGKRAVIKSCRNGTTSFGITTAMLERLDVALVAVEGPAGAYNVYELPIARFRAGMRDSQSGKADGRVKLLARADAERRGRPIGCFSAVEIEATKACSGVTLKN